MKALQTASVVLTKRLNEGATPLDHLKSTAYGKHTIRAVNIILRRYTTDRNEKLRLAQAMYALPYKPQSTYDLTVGQASALIALSRINPKLLDAYILKIKEKLTYECI